jgi:hypothetical protein
MYYLLSKVDETEISGNLRSDFAVFDLGTEDLESFSDPMNHLLDLGPSFLPRRDGSDRNGLGQVSDPLFPVCIDVLEHLFHGFTSHLE